MKTKRLEINDTLGLPYALVTIDPSRHRDKRWSVTLWSGTVTDKTPQMAIRRTTKRHVRDVLRRALRRIPTLNDIAV